MCCWLLNGTALHAEGSRDVTPARSGAATGNNQFIGYLQHDDGNNSDLFMKPGASADYRLYVRMLPNETVYYGVRRIATNSTGNQNDLIITIRDAAGNLASYPAFFFLLCHLPGTPTARITK